MYGISIEQLDGGIISSVVPPVTNIVKRSVEKILNTEVMLIGPGVKTGLNILMDDPRQVGSDRIVNAVAVVHEYPAVSYTHLFQYGRSNRKRVRH